MKAHRWNVPKTEEMTEVQYWVSAAALTSFIAVFIISGVIILWGLLS